MAIFQVLRQHLDSRFGHYLEVAEEAIHDIGTILVVETMRRISWFRAQPSPQTLRNEDGIGIDLDGVIRRLPLGNLANFDPNLVEKCPIDPSARILALHLVELAESVFH